MNIQIVLSGVGGQGILFASKIFSELGRMKGVGVMGAETHGMSQRGGSVVAHLKLGDYMSPMVRTGNADVLYAFEENEAYRTISYLKKGGLCFVNLSPSQSFHKDILEYFQKTKSRLLSFDASGKALEIGARRAANILLIGFSVGTGLVPFADKELQRVIRTLSRKNSAGKNLEAFQLGVQAGLSQRLQD